MPLVSVIIPARNAQATLAFTIRSLLDQSLTDWEAVVVDDGSTDGTAGILSDFAWRDRRIRLLRSARPGRAESLNAGIEAATGDYVHLLEPGSFVTPLGVEHLLQAAEWSGLGAACGPVGLHGADGRPFGVSVRCGPDVVGAEQLLSSRFLAPAAHIVRRDALASVRFDPSIHGFHELDLRLRLAARGVRWASVESEVAHARVSPVARGRGLRLGLDSLAGVIARASGPERWRREALRRSALFFATTSALSDREGSCRGASAMLRMGAGPAVHSPEELGAAAYWSLVLGFAIPPRKIAPSIAAWLPRLERWWSIVRPGCRDEALRAIALEAIQPEMVASAMLAAVPGGSPAVVAGALGSNGRAIVLAARSRGVRLTLRDDRMPRAGIERLIEADSTVLVAPNEDEPILEKLPRGATTVRWRSTHEDLAERLLVHFRSQSEPAEMRA